MDDTFARRIRLAAAAGWWTLLIVAAFMLLQYAAYLVIMSARPAWMLALWGPDVSWQTMQSIWLWSLAVFKICMWVLIVLLIWLTLWASRLRKA